MTCKDAWIGEQLQRGAELAVADINAKGGVLGQPVQLITADDFCDPEQAGRRRAQVGQRRRDLRRRTLLLQRLDAGL
jgi:ABC-type branched-subunit amino acid transport system substrate-binding protein